MSRHLIRRGLLLATAALAAASLLAAPAAAASRKAAPPKGAHAMTPFEVVKLYRGKTWMWPAGGGFFEPGARFFAWSSEPGKSPSYALGRWMAMEDGRMCMKAKWFSSAGKGAPATTCFAHSVAGNVVYQRRMPSGDWYVFRADPPAADNEFAKLKDGDLVKAKIVELGGMPPDPAQ